MVLRFCFFFLPFLLDDTLAPVEMEEESGKELEEESGKTGAGCVVLMGVANWTCNGVLPGARDEEIAGAGALVSSPTPIVKSVTSTPGGEGTVGARVLP